MPLLPTLSLLLFMKLRVFQSYWTTRASEFLLDHWKLEITEAMSLMVADNDPLTSQADIGAHLSLHPNSMVALVRRLRRRRLIAISRHPKDHRKQIITLTPRGLEIAREIRARYPEILAYGLGLGPEDLVHLDALITSAINALSTRPLRPSTKSVAVEA
jgi:DNA-binding MarR family transcriptional regulator